MCLNIHDVSPILDVPAVHVHTPRPESHQEPSLPHNVTCLSTPFQPKNFEFPKTKYGKQLRSFQSTCIELFPWIHYNEENDSVLCFICAKQNAKNYSCCLPRKKSKLSFRLDILTGNKHSKCLKSTNFLTVTNCQLTTMLTF